MEYAKPAYNKHEHDFVERSDERLQHELADLHINLRNINYTGERLADVQRTIGHISFEMSCRYAESKNIDSEIAWAEHELR